MLIDENKPFYSVVQVAELLGISADRLRTYDEEYLVAPSREKNNKRLYSQLDIEWLQNLRKLISKNKMNIFAFKIVLTMLYNMSDNEFDKILRSEKDEVWSVLNEMKQNPNYEKLKNYYHPVTY